MDIGGSAWGNPYQIESFKVSTVPFDSKNDALYTAPCERGGQGSTSRQPYFDILSGASQLGYVKYTQGENKGSVYAGFLKDGNSCGLGIFLDAVDEAVKAGTWVDNKLTGEGMYKSRDFVQVAQFDSDQAHGEYGACVHHNPMAGADDRVIVVEPSVVGRMHYMDSEMDWNAWAVVGCNHYVMGNLAFSDLSHVSVPPYLAFDGWSTSLTSLTSLVFFFLQAQCTRKMGDCSSVRFYTIRSVALACSSQPIGRSHLTLGQSRTMCLCFQQYTQSSSLRPKKHVQVRSAQHTSMRSLRCLHVPIHVPICLPVPQPRLLPSLVCGVA